MTEGVIRELLNHPTAPVQDIPKYLAGQFLRISMIRNRVYKHQERLRKLKEEHESAVKKEKEDFKKVQDECRHEEADFHSDPAGGRDSYRECTICGKIL